MFDVRSLAALDMHGLHGTRRRRRLILAEFLFAPLALPSLGATILANGPSTASVVLAVWLLGTGINYVALAVHAITLASPGALDAALAGHDVRGLLRTYTRRQIYLLVPLLIAVLALHQATGRANLPR